MEVSYAGTEHIGPEDTFDADYGRLLEAVQNRGKDLTSPRGPVTRWNLPSAGKRLHQHGAWLGLPDTDAVEGNSAGGRLACQGAARKRLIALFRNVTSSGLLPVPAL